MSDTPAEAVANQYGAVEMVIACEEGKVIQRFNKDTRFIVYDPPNVIAVAEALVRAAWEADTNLKPLGDTLKASLVERHRDVLIPRIALMLNSMRENKVLTNGQIAIQIMDVICAEIFS